MCGIVGLHLKNPDLQPRLGELLTVMLEAMTTRGPDSAGIAVYADPAGPPGAGSPGAGSPGAGSPGAEPDLRYSLRSDTGATDWELLGKALAADTGGEVSVRRLAADSAVLTSPAAEAAFLAAVRRAAPEVTVAGYGRAMLLVKDVGAPADICVRYGIPGWSGYQGSGQFPG